MQGYHRWPLVWQLSVGDNDFQKKRKIQFSDPLGDDYRIWQSMN